LALGVYPRGDGQHEPTIYTLNYEWADQNSQLGPCNPDITFIIYIDPAGYIYDVDTLDRVSDANVWLQRSDGQGGWGNVPTGQALPIMQPDVNPLTANANGQYQWNVLDGTYRVHVEASNYYPADSIVVNIPPPVFDLNIGLNRVPGTDKPPVADASGPTIGFVGDVLSFDGSASHDPYGRIVSYQWTFGDGDSAGGAYVTHTYTTPGYYETRLIVTDNGGLSDSKSILLTISLVPTPGLPVAVALITPNPGIVGQTIQFDGSSSYHQDPTKSIDSWSWDINNDGSYEIEGMEVLHSFSTAGSYPVKLQVSDNGDPEHFAETTLMVVIKDQNPVPEFPTVAFPAALLVGLIGAVFFIQRTRKH
jgi:PKD repeat protein